MSRIAKKLLPISPLPTLMGMISTMLANGTDAYRRSAIEHSASFIPESRTKALSRLDEFAPRRGAIVRRFK